MPNRTPTEGTSSTPADRRRERLADPEDSGHFDPAIAPDPPQYRCTFAERRQGEYGQEGWRCRLSLDHDGDHDMAFVLELDPAATDSTETLPAVPPPDGGEAADPPATPGDSGETPEPSHTPDVAAGSGGGSGRPLALVQPDASEKVLGAAMGVINPAADPSYAIRHAEESARVLIIGQHFAAMLQAISPPAALLVDEKDVRGMYHYLRLIAVTHGIDLDGES